MSSHMVRLRSVLLLHLFLSLLRKSQFDHDTKQHIADIRDRVEADSQKIDCARPQDHVLDSTTFLAYLKTLNANEQAIAKLRSGPGLCWARSQRMCLLFTFSAIASQGVACSRCVQIAGMEVNIYASARASSLWHRRWQMPFQRKRCDCRPR